MIAHSFPARPCRRERHSLLITLELARLRTYPQHTRAWLPLLRSRPGGVHRHYVVRSPKSDNLSKSTGIPACQSLFAFRLGNRRITEKHHEQEWTVLFFAIGLSSGVEFQPVS